MSSKIDQRIVEMSFENQKFEKGINQSRNSLKDFSNALGNMGTGKEFTGLERSISSMSSSFSVLEQIGVGALRRIGEMAINTGANIFKSLAIEPITQGFDEMDLKLNSTQTIMASTGETLAVVNGYLQELNEYSDRTIYSFSDMTQNIGKFTNAGVKLDMAVASIKGISNAAALAGANSNEASRAMYNFAQALSAGYVKLIDWKSIENANMATVEFKQQLMDSAVAAGTLTKSADGMYRVLSTNLTGKTMESTISATRNFNESLSYQWMTTDALTRTLSDYADETTEIGKRASQAATQVTTFTKLMDTLKESVGSGWAQTFEIIFGDFNEARDLWTGMNDTLGEMINTLSDGRNALLSGGLGSGWKQFVKEGIENIEDFENTFAVVAGEAGLDIDELVKKAGSMDKAVKDNWVTGEMLVETVNRMSSSIEELSGEELLAAGYTQKTKDQLLALRDALASGTISADEFAKKMASMSGRDNIITGLKNSVVALLTALKSVSKAFDQIFPPMTVDRLYKLTENFKNFTSQLIISEKTANKIQRTFAGFFAVLDIGWDVIKLVGNAVYEVVGVFIPLNGSILEVTASIGDWLVSLNRSIKETGVFQYALMGIQIAAIYLRDAFATIIDKISKFISGILNAEKPLEYLGKTMQTVFGNVVGQIQEIIKWLSGKFTSAVTGIQKLFKPLDDENGNFLLNILKILKDFIDFLIEDATEGIANFGEALKKLDFNRIATFVTGGVLLLFVNQLSNLTKSMATFITTSNTFVSRWSKKLFGYTTKIKDLAYVFGILSASLFVLSKIPWNELVRGLVGLAGAMLIFVGAYAAIQAITVKSSKAMNGAETFKTAFGLMNLAASVAIMAVAIKQISKIDKTEVWRAVGVMTVMTIVITGYQALSALISTIPGQTIVSVKLTSMAIGIATLLGVVVLLSSISQATIENGLSKLSGFILIVASIQGLFSTVAMVTGGHKLSTNLIGISTGILALLGVMKILSVIDTSELTKNIQNVFLLGGVLAAIQLMFNIAGRIGGGVKFKTNVFSMQMGLLAMVALIAILNTMDQKTIQNGIENLTKMAGIIAALEILTALAARIGAGNKLQKILGSVTLTMLAFTVLIGVLGLYEQTTIDRGLINISKMVGIITALQVLTALASRLGNPQSLTSIIGAVSILLAVTGSLALLSMIDQEALRKATTSFAIAVIAIGVAATSFELISKSLSILASNMSGLKTIVTTVIPGFTAMAAVVVATIAFLGIINSLDFTNISWDNIGKFAAGIGIITTLVTAFILLTKAPGLTSGVAGITALVPGFAAMGIAVVAAGALLWALVKQSDTFQNLSWGTIGKFAAGLGIVGIVAVAMSLLSIPLGALGVAFPAVIPGVLTALAGLSLIVLGFAGLADIMNTLFDSDTLINGIDKLVLVGEGLGRFVGSMASGFSSEILVGFGQGLAEFSEATSQIKADSFAGIESLAKAILIITGTSMIDGLARLANFGRDPIKVFGDSLKTLVGAFSEITVEEAGRVSNVLAALVPMAGSLSAITNVANTIPDSGGIFELFTGNNDIAAFGVQLRLVIGAFKKITVEEAGRVANVLTALTPMAASFGAFASVANTIPNSGGIFTLFTGDNEIVTFGVQLRLVVATFNSLDTADVANASLNLNLMSTSLLPALEKFSTFSNNLGNSGGLKQLFTGNTTLSEFGKEIAKFVKELKGVDFSVVQPALESLSGITASFQVVGAEVLANAAESFRNNQQPFQKEITSILDTAIATVDTKKKIMVTSITAVFSEVTSKSNTYVKDFKKLGSDVVIGLKNGIESQTPFAVSAIRKTSNSIIKASKSTFESGSPSKIFTEIGAWLPKSLGNGIESNGKTARLAAINMSEGVEEAVRTTLGVHSLSEKFTEIGGWIDKSLSSGIQNGKDTLLKTAQSLGLDTGKLTLKGVTDSVTGGESGITTAITDLLDLLSGSTTIEDVAKITGTPTGTNIADSITSATQKALGNSISGLGGTKTQVIVKTELEKIQAIIEDKKYYGQLSLEEELKYYEDLRKVKNQSAEDIKRIDREVYRLVKEIYEAQLSYIEEVTEAETEAAEKREDLYKDYIANQESITADSEKRISDLQKKYDDDRASAKESARKKELEAEEKYYNDYNNILTRAEEERQQLRNEYANTQKSINAQLLSDIEAQNTAYENAVKSRTDAIYGAYSLFSAVKEDDAVTGDELLQNLRDQGAALSEWEQALSALEGRGVGEGLIEELQKLGPSSKAQIKALLELTDEQLNEYVSLFEGKYAFARIKAETELEDLRISTEQTIKDLNSQASIDLDELEYTFAESMKDINTQMSDDLSELKASHKATMAEINDELKSELKELKTSFKKSSKEINDDTAKQLSDLEDEYTKSLTTINTDTTKKLNDLKTSFTSTMKTINSLSEAELRQLISENQVKLTALNTDTTALLQKVENTYDASGNRILSGASSNMQKLTAQTTNEVGSLQTRVLSELGSYTSDFETVGYQASQGFAMGIRSGNYLAVSAAKYLASTAVLAAREVLDEHSPSRVLFNSGKFFSLGFANGITSSADQAELASRKMAENSIAVMSQALANLESEVDTDIWEPVIAPVLDLSNIRGSDLNWLRRENINLALRSSQMANEINQNGSRESAAGSTIINQFDLTGLTVRTEADIDAIATKLYQKQQSAQRGRGIRVVPTGR